MFTDGRTYFETVAKPHYDLFLTNPSPATCWAAVVSMHHVADYYVCENEGSLEINEFNERLRIFREDNDLKTLGRLADCLKHSEKREKQKVVVLATSTVEDFLGCPDLFAEPNVFGIYIVQVDGLPISVGPTLKSALEFWASTLGR